MRRESLAQLLGERLHRLLAGNAGRAHQLDRGAENGRHPAQRWRGAEEDHDDSHDDERQQGRHDGVEEQVDVGLGLALQHPAGRAIEDLPDEPAQVGLLIRRPRLLWIFAEPERGRLSAARLASLAELRACHQVAVVMRPTTSPYWEQEIYVGKVTQYTMKDVSIDDVKFGVKAIGLDGSESLVSAYVYPPRQKTEIETVASEPRP